MAIFARRRTPVLASFSVSLFALLVACGSSNDAKPPTEPTPDAGSAPDASSTPDAEPESKDVIVRFTARYNLGGANVVEISSMPGLESTFAAIVTIDGAKRTLPGTARPDGTVVIPDVPDGPYVLERRASYPGSPENDPPQVTQWPVDGARNVRIGPDYWPRHGATPITPTTKLALTVNAPAGFVNNDTFSWIGLRSYFYMTATYASPIPEPQEGHANVPAAGATSSAAWTIDADVLAAPYGTEAMGLPVASSGDDLAILQTRTSTIGRPGDPFDPWNTVRATQVVGKLDVPSPTFTNETTNTVTGTLAAPAKESLTLDIHGTSFATIRQDAQYPAATRTTARVYVAHEAGQGPGYFVSVAPVSWELSASSKPNPVVRECFPEGSGTICNPMACPVDCANAVDGLIDPGEVTYTFDAPRLYESGIRDLSGFSYSFTYSWKAPHGSTTTLTASARMTRPKSGTAASFELEMGPIRNLRLNGDAIPWDGPEMITGSEATVSFDPPAFGSPEYYRVTVIELLPDAGPEGGPSRPSRDAASVYSRETTVAIPEGVLRKEHHYYVRVEAMRDGRDFSNPFNPKSDTVLNTGVFSAPFNVK